MGTISLLFYSYLQLSQVFANVPNAVSDTSRAICTMESSSNNEYYSCFAAVPEDNQKGLNVTIYTLEETYLGEWDEESQFEYQGLSNDDVVIEIYPNY